MSQRRATVVKEKGRQSDGPSIVSGDLAVGLAVPYGADPRVKRGKPRYPVRKLSSRFVRIFCGKGAQKIRKIDLNSCLIPPSGRLKHACDSLLVPGE